MKIEGFVKRIMQQTRICLLLCESEKERKELFAEQFDKLDKRFQKEGWY